MIDLLMRQFNVESLEELVGREIYTEPRSFMSLRLEGEINLADPLGQFEERGRKSTGDKTKFMPRGEVVAAFEHNDGRRYLVLLLRQRGWPTMLYLVNDADIITAGPMEQFQPKSDLHELFPPKRAA